jgi:hypothetical protein
MAAAVHIDWQLPRQDEIATLAAPDSNDVPIKDVELRLQERGWNLRFGED